MRYGKSMSEALAEIREGFSKKEIKMAIGIASDPRYKQGNYSGAVRQIEKIKKGLASHPQVAAVLKRQNEEILEKVKCPDCEGEGCPKCEGNGYIADAVDKEDEPFLKDLIKNLRKGSATHSKQADDLEKAVKEEIDLDEQFDFVLLDKDNKIVARASGKNAKKEMESSKKSAHLPPMRIPKNEVGKMKIVPINPKDKKGIGDMVLAIGEEVELDENRAARDAKRAMAKDKDMQQRPFDKDIKATGADIMKGKKNIVLQLKRAMNLGGSLPITFASGPDKKVDPKFARAALDKLDKIKRSDDKLKFQTKLSKSYKDMLQALKEEFELDEAKIVVDLENDDPKLMRDIKKFGLKVKDLGDSGNAGYNEYEISGPQSKIDAANKKLKLMPESFTEGKMKAIAMKIDSVVAKMKKDKQMKSFADKFKKDAMKSMNIAKSLEKVLPDYIAGKDIAALVKEETVVESWELDEMKMDDPKLLKIFDKLKKGSTVKIKIDSSISKGKDYREFTVTAKNIVGKGKKFEQEKITLKAKDNPTGVKHFLYNRDGKVTLAIGDMGASIADIKENNMSAYTAAITKGVK